MLLMCVGASFSRIPVPKPRTWRCIRVYGSQNLTNHERAVIHAECRKYGFTSKSFGVGEDRRCHVRKPKQTVRRRAFDVPFADSSLDAMSAHQDRFPLQDTEAPYVLPPPVLQRAGISAIATGDDFSADYNHESASEAAAKPGKRRRRDQPSPALPPEDLLRRHEQYEANARTPAMREVMECRCGLGLDLRAGAYGRRWRELCRSARRGIRYRADEPAAALAQLPQ